MMGLETYARVCSLKNQEIYPITRDVSTGSFNFIQFEDFLHSEQDQSILASSPYLLSGAASSNLSSSLQDSETRLDPDIIGRYRISNDNGTVYFVRECICAFDERVYCPIEMDMCGMYEDFSLPVDCFNMPMERHLLLHGWPIILLWYAAIVFFFVFTDRGQLARQYIYDKLFPNNRETQRQVDRVMYDGAFVNGRFHFRPESILRDPSVFYLRGLAVGNAPTEISDRETEGTATEEGRCPTQLLLKTKTYRLSQINVENSDDEDEDDSCAICFSSLEDGDRIGALPCKHHFHVDCLKIWLCRRNVCPLCQTANAANPGYGENSSNKGNSQPSEDG